MKCLLAAAASMLACVECTPHTTPTCRAAVQQVASTTHAAEPGTAAAGIESCDEDTWNRTAAGACVVDPGIRACGPNDVGSCRSDADCPGGRCATGVDGCACVAVCKSDADCNAGEACLCSAATPIENNSFAALAPLPTCVPASCRTAADCNGAACGIALDTPCRNPIALRCRSATDSCGSDADCQSPDHCDSDAQSSSWICRNVSGGCE